MALRPRGAILDTYVVHLTTANDGSAVKTVTASSPTCNGEPGHKCLCSSCSLDKTIACENDVDCAAASAGTCTNNAGTPRETSACIDDTATPGDESLCTSLGGGGICSESVGARPRSNARTDSRYAIAFFSRRRASSAGENPQSASASSVC